MTGKLSKLTFVLPLLYFSFSSYRKVIGALKTIMNYSGLSCSTFYCISWWGGCRNPTGTLTRLLFFPRYLLAQLRCIKRATTVHANNCDQSPTTSVTVSITIGNIANKCSLNFLSLTYILEVPRPPRLLASDAKQELDSVVNWFARYDRRGLGRIALRHTLAVTSQFYVLTSRCLFLDTLLGTQWTLLQWKHVNFLDRMNSIVLICPHTQ